jgi:hypothetical protein
MRKRTTHYYLIKIARLSGWLLLGLMVLYIGTGFALCGKFGVDRLIDKDTALFIHQVFDWPLVSIFSVHACIVSYFAMRRRGWIRKRR